MTTPTLGKGATTLRSVPRPGRRRRCEHGQPRSAEQVAGAQERRANRWQRRTQLRRISKLKRVRYCGHTMNAEAGVTLGVIENSDGTRSAAYGGLKTCGSVWCCPVCAAKIATRRADDLATVMRAVDELGGSAFLLTLTMRHDHGDRLGLSAPDRAHRKRLEERLADVQVAEANGWDVDERQAEADAIELDSLKAQEGCWDVLSYAWRRVTSGSSWQEDCGRFGGLLGWARAVEVTDGDNGWHVHLHVLLCFREQVSAELARAALGPRLFGRWNRALQTPGVLGIAGTRVGLSPGPARRRRPRGLLHQDGPRGHQRPPQGRPRPRRADPDAAAGGGRRDRRRVGPRALVGVGDRLGWPPAIDMVDRTARPACAVRAGAGGQRRRDRRGPGGSRRPAGPSSGHLAFTVHLGPGLRRAGSR